MLRPPGPSRLAPAALPAAGGPASGLLIKIVAENFAFDLAEFSVPADTPFQIEFDHRDVKIPHNVAVYDFGTEGAGAVPRRDLQRTQGRHVRRAGPAGCETTTSQCDPHPYMNGKVKVT